MSLTYDRFLTSQIINVNYNYELTCERIIEAISRDSVLNPLNSLRWPCSICNKNVTHSIKGIQCNLCDKWSHIKCNGITVNEYEHLDDEFTEWFCLYCSIKLNHNNFPFTLVDNSEINNINNSDSMHFLQCFPNSEYINSCK